ncbi:MAG: DNA repair protein RecO [Planctomycetota bacterium]
MPTVFDEGICVRHWDWSETSQTVTLMTRDHGLLRCLAKGSKREKAPFSGGVELLARAELGVIIKAGTGLATLTSWDLSEPMPAVRSSFGRYAACVYAADLVPRSLQDHDPHPRLFRAFADTLASIGGASAVDAAAIPAWLAWFQWQLLNEVGSKPEVSVDVRTGECLPDSAAVGFAWELGGLTALRAGESSSDSIARTSPSTVSVLRMLDAGIQADGLAGSPDGITRCGRVLAAALRRIFDDEPPSLVWIYPEIATRNTT